MASDQKFSAHQAHRSILRQLSLSLKTCEFSSKMSCFDKRIGPIPEKNQRIQAPIHLPGAQLLLNGGELRRKLATSRISGTKKPHQMAGLRCIFLCV
jgi:hypothetical protein